MIALLTLVLASADINYIVVDVRTRQIVKQDWPDADRPFPVGSLVKPFTALASSGPFPEFVCNGAADRCWLAKGHGSLRFRDALANSDAMVHLLDCEIPQSARFRESKGITYLTLGNAQNVETLKISIEDLAAVVQEAMGL